MQQLPLSEAAVRDTIAAVFRAAAYDRTLRETLWDRFLAWVGRLLSPLGSAIGGSPALQRFLLAALLLVLGALLARVALLAYVQRGRSATTPAPGSLARARVARDPWAVAQAEAAMGNFTAAAHALYAALLLAVARDERLRLHPSKTIGDYARELRQRSSALFTRFREFARTYEAVVYGVGSCDRERYERLHALAATIVRLGR